MPINKNKWAVVFELTYQYFKAEERPITENAKVDYKSIELPIGIRHYFFLNENSKIFINASNIFDAPNRNSNIDYDNVADLKIKTSTNFAFGLGYKYSLELGYQTSRDVL